MYATARRPQTLAPLEAVGCRTLALDVTDEASMAAAVEVVREAEGAVGVLVNNAGYSQSGAVETVSPEALRRQFETNVFGAVRMAQLVLPGMREQRWGRILNVTSMGANFTFPGGGVYHATKHALASLTEALRFEVKGFGVEVVDVQPGLIRTEFAETASGAIPEGDEAYAGFHRALGEATKGVYEEGPLAKLGAGPEAVAEAIEKAIAKPRAKVLVTPSAHVMVRQHALTPRFVWDRVLASQFPRPGEG